MGFGTSYSLVHVDCLDWVHTSWKLRVVRGIIGCAISVGVYFLFMLIPCNDNPTKYFFQYALPALFISFFIYGVYPILCLKMKLVKENSGEFSYQTENMLARRSSNETKKMQDTEGNEEEQDKKGD